MNISRSCSPDNHVPRAVEPTNCPKIHSVLPMSLIFPIRDVATAFSFNSLHPWVLSAKVWIL